MKVWDRAGIELATPGSAVRLTSVARHVTDCATRPGCSVFNVCQSNTLTVIIHVVILFKPFPTIHLMMGCALVVYLPV